MLDIVLVFNKCFFCILLVFPEAKKKLPKKNVTHSNRMKIIYFNSALILSFYFKIKKCYASIVPF